jgi:hypothetical protein
MKKSGGIVEPLGGKEPFCEISVSNFSKEVKFSLKWVKQSEQILFEKLNVSDAENHTQKECSV